MASDIFIEFDDEDESESQSDSLNFKSDTIGPSSGGASGTEIFDFGQAIDSNDRARKQQIDRQNRDSLRRRKEQQAEDRRLLMEEQQDKRRQQRHEQQAMKDVSREAVREARSDAISQRVQAYSVSAALGLPGYVAASVVDKFLIRPREEEVTASEHLYQQQLADYQRRVETDRINQRRAKEEQIRNRPVDATVVPNVDFFGNPLPSTVGPKPYPGLGRPGSFPVGGTRVPGGPPQPPTQPPYGGPPPPIIPPNRPTPSTPNPLLAGLGTAGAVLTAAFYARDLINSAVEGAAKGAQQFAIGTLTGSTKEGLTQLGRGVRGVSDPLHFNVPLTVAVQGFEALLAVNEAIKEAIQKDIGFSPQTLVASVEGNISKLLQRMELAQRLDPLTARFTEVNNRLDLAWNELKASLLEMYLPRIISLLESLVFLVQIVDTGVQILGAIRAVVDWIRNPNQAAVNAILSIADMIAGALTAADQAGFEKQAEMFFGQDPFYGFKNAVPMPQNP